MPRNPDGEISVYRAEGLDSSEIKVLGDAHVATATSPVKGHCVQPAIGFLSLGLGIESAPNPHPRHANVVGWVTDPQNRIIAKKLADQAVLTVY